MRTSEEIKESIKKGKAIIGFNRTLKGLKTGNIEKIYFAKDCPKKLKIAIVLTAEITKTEVKRFLKTSKELGTICKKPFQISVLSIKK